MTRQNIRLSAGGTSFLFVLVIALIFLYAQSLSSSPVFPQQVEAWNRILTVYLVVFSLALILSLIYAREVIRGLVSTNPWKSFAYKFIPSAVVTLIVLMIVKAFVKGPDSLNIFSAVSYMNPGILLVHLLVVSQIEEILFAGIIYKTVQKRSGETSANIATMILFGLWHFAKTGGSILAMAIYIPLRYWWNYVSRYGTPYLAQVFPKYVGPSPETQQANAGSHFAWNMFAIGYGGI